MTRRLRSLLPVLALLACAAPAHGAEKGVATDLTWNLTQETAEQEAGVLRDLGAQWATVDLSWRNTETADGTYVQAEFDNLARAISLARGAGARVLLTISETPQWASGNPDPRHAPADPGKLAEFYAEIVGRFGASVDAWQVWNEPNHPHFWQPDPTSDPNACAGYGALLRAVAPVIRAGDPTGRVLFGGLAHNDHAYLQRCLELDPQLPASFDVMVTHPYAAGGAAPETQADADPADGRLDSRTFLAYREIRALVDKPIWFTEMGWSTCTDGHPLGCVTPEVQADYLERAYELLEQDPYVQVAIWYSLRNIGPDGPSWLDQLGLHTNAFAPKPAAAAFRAYRPPAPQAGQEPVPGSPQPLPAEPGTTPDGGGSGPVVKAAVRLRVRRVGARRLRIRGSVTGASPRRVTLVLQRRRAGAYRTARRVKAKVSGERFARRVRLPRAGRWRVQARLAGSGVASRFVAFRVRR